MAEAVTMMMQAFDFRGEPMVFRKAPDGQWVLTTEQLARGLSYSDQRKVSHLFKRHEREFKSGESCVLTMGTQGGQGRRTRVFTPRGAMRVALHADTDVAEDFRDFVLDVMDKLRSGEAGLITPEQLTAIVAAAITKAIQANDAQWTTRLAAVEARFDRLLESNHQIVGLAASAMAHRRHQKAREQALKAEIALGQSFMWTDRQARN